MKNSTANSEPSVANEDHQHGLRIWEEKEIEYVKNKTIRRLSLRNFWTEVVNAFNLDRGFLYTMIGLTRSPAKTILGYLDAQRFVVTSPIKYFLVIIGITIFVANHNGYFQNQQDAFRTGMEIGTADDTSERSAESLAKKDAFQKELAYLFEEYFLKYQNIWSAISIIFTTLLSFLFFRKSRFNFMENLAMNTYIYNQGYIIFFVMVIFNLKGMAWSNLYLGFNIIYSIIVFKGVFKRKWSTTLFKGLAINLLSLALFIGFGVSAMFIYHAVKNL